MHWDNWIHDARLRAIEQQPWQTLEVMRPEKLFAILDSMAEPSYQEVLTSSFISDYFLSRGFQIRPESGQDRYQTEVIVGSSSAAQIAIRCDLDAVSQGKGAYAHNCGHSINMASLLTLATRPSIASQSNALAFIFQPAEEGPGRAEDGYRNPVGMGGGQYLRSKGVYARVRSLVSCHIDTSLKPDEVRITPGEATAMANRFVRTFNGKVAHAAQPWFGKNPIDGVSHLLSVFELLNKRLGSLAPPQFGLVTPTKIMVADGDLNSLPRWARVEGITRTVGDAAYDVLMSVTSSEGAEIELEAPPVWNDPHLARVASNVAEGLGLRIEARPARFRDETAWAGPIRARGTPASKYPKGCRNVLHFFVSGGRNSGALHSDTFKPSVAPTIHTQVSMVEGIIERQNT